MLVGGCVRDHLMGREPHDFDLVTKARASEVKVALRGKVESFVEVGEAFGIVVCVFGGETYEIASTREDIGIGDGRHPNHVNLGVCIERDLERRDFTMNAMAMDVDGRIIDPLGGAEDIKNKVIRFVGDPEERIREDHLRVLRAIRFQSQLGFEIETESLRAIEADHSLDGVSQERITAELTKLILGSNAPLAIDTLRTAGILFEVIPELERLLEPHDSPFHLESDDTGNSIYAHVRLVFEHACGETEGFDSDRKLRLRLASLFHDIAKPQTREPKNGHSRYLGHDRKGAALTREIMVRMRFPNDLIKKVTDIVHLHMMVHDLGKMVRINKIRRFLGRENIDDLLLMGEVDTLGTSNEMGLTIYNRTAEIVEEHRRRFPVMLPERLVTGADLIEAGLEPGPSFAVALEDAYDLQLCGCENKAKCLKHAISRVKTCSS
jgi:poly(A) polymerase